MRILEKQPSKYDEAFERITRGASVQIIERVLELVQPDTKVLDIGCGTGRLAIAVAAKGANVTAVDRSRSMINHARQRAEESGLKEKITFKHGDIREIKLEQEHYDIIVSTFMLSELPKPTQQTFFVKTHKMLKKDGVLILADETTPTELKKRLKFRFLRLFYILRVLIRLGRLTHPLHDLNDDIQKEGFITSREERLGDGSIIYIETALTEEPEPVLRDWKQEIGKFKFLKIIMCILFGTFFFPWSVTPGLYKFGSPTPKDPVLVTCNYYYTFSRVCSALREENAYLLVADTGGINVWCGAGAGRFTAFQVVDAVIGTRIDKIIGRKRLILPQLGAKGISKEEVIKLTDWQAEFGPVDILSYTQYRRNGFQKDQEMATVKFDILERTKMGFQAGFFLTTLFLPISIILAILSVLFPVFWGFTSISVISMAWICPITVLYSLSLPLLVPRRFIFKSIMFGVILGVIVEILTLLSFLSGSQGSLFQLIAHPLWVLILGIFVGADFAGHTPFVGTNEMLEDMGLSLLLGTIMFLLGIVALIIGRGFMLW